MSELEKKIISENFVLSATSGLVQWLLEQNITLSFSTYQTGKLFFIGLDKSRQCLTVFERNYKRCMGLCKHEKSDSFYMSTLFQIFRFNNILDHGGRYQHYKKIYVPQTAYITGKLDIHDMACWHGIPIFVNTLFNCVAKVSETHSFEVIWKPPFITEVVPEDRCHLNGLAMREGRPYAVTAISSSNEKEGWRGNRVNGGVLVDISSHEIIAEGLSMPHSPRYHNGRIWLLNSGKGELGFVENGQFVPVVCCPGYLRGLCFVNDYAIVGLSLPRGSSLFQDLELDRRLPELGGACCGLQIINTRTGVVVHTIKIEGVVQELYDVMAIPDALCPMLLGFESDDIHRMISIG